ncbi:M56 family metallopeptidase [Ureibacillus composti]
MSKRHSTIIFILPLIISGTLFIQMALYFVSILFDWNVKFNLVIACHSLLKSIGLSSLQFILDLLVIYTMVFIFWKISSQLFHSIRLNKKFHSYKDHRFTTELNEKYRNEQECLLVVSYPAPIAITMGFIRPKIVLSTALINLLTEEELKAVISHEYYHLENRDPLKIFILSLCASTMWYIPILKWFTQQYRIIQEVLADEFAIKKQETTVNLGSALLKMLKVGRPIKMPFAYVSFADTSVNYRIEYLLNPLTDIQWKIPLKEAFVSTAIFTIICAFFIYAFA